MTTENGRGTSRSGFLKQAAGATMAVAGAGVGAGAIVSGASAASGKSFTSGHFSLEIDGFNVGAIASASGGNPGYDVVLDQPVGSDGVQRKHIGGVKYEDISIQVGSGMSKAMYDWIKASFDKGSVRKNGAIVAADFNYNEKSRLEFSNALITEVGFPALDGASKDPGYFTVKISPASVANLPGSGAPVQAAKQKAWLCSNFKVVINGLDTTRVSKIDSFTWKQSVAADGSVVLDAGDLSVSFPAASLPSWQRWYDSFPTSGVANEERDGVLELVGQDGTVLDLGLLNLGVYQLKDTGGAGNKRFNVELYVEEMVFKVVKVQ